MAVRLKWGGDRLLNALTLGSIRRTEALAQWAASRAQSYAPVDTGALKASIEAERISRRRWEVGPSVEIHYAGYQEFGTRFMPAQPYMRPALDDVRTVAIAFLARGLVPVIRRGDYLRGVPSERLR